MENTSIIVEYKYKTINDRYGDLVCELTEFMDKYLIDLTELFRTYLYNDIGVFSKMGFLQIAVRVPRSYNWVNTSRKIKC